mgnify:CR=1 FL=1
MNCTYWFNAGSMKLTHSFQWLAVSKHTYYKFTYKFPCDAILCNNLVFFVRLQSEWPSFVSYESDIPPCHASLSIHSYSLNLIKSTLYI